MTHTTPTPGAEPHQPGEREAIVALACVLVDDAGFDHDDASDMAERLLAVWPDARRTVDLVAVAKMLRDEQEAALAHLAERRAGDVEAVAKVLREHFTTYHTDWGYICSCGWRPGHLVSSVIPAIAAHQAAQIAVLTPTRGVSAEQAWDEGYQQGAYDTLGSPRDAHENPYRAALADPTPEADA